MIDVSILIVCYNSLPFIEQCIRSVRQHVSGCSYEVLLVDCSSDGVVEFVREHFPEVRIIENSENLGFSKGNNLLAQHAVGRHLLLLNADAYFTDDALTELVRCADDKKWAPLGAAGGRARRPDGRRDPGSRQYLPTLFRLAVAAVGGARYLNGALPEEAGEPAVVESLTGAFMLVPADVWREFGGLDETFFAYCEEMDLCMRLRQAGKRVVMTPHAEVVHIGGGGTHRAERTLIRTRALKHLLNKHSKNKSSLAGVIIWLHSAIRFVVGTCCGPRGKDLKKSFEQTARHPRTWWAGFDL